MKLRTAGAIVLLNIGILFGCKPRPAIVPKVFLVNASSGHRVTIRADEEIIWDRVVPESAVMPNINEAQIPLTKRKMCTITTVGGPYNATLAVDWRKGDVVIVHFEKASVFLSQRKGPVRFQ